jgi:nucleotide-binding universal stress UspA family protein
MDSPIATPIYLSCGTCVGKAREFISPYERGILKSKSKKSGGGKRFSTCIRRLRLLSYGLSNVRRLSETEFGLGRTGVFHMYDHILVALDGSEPSGRSGRITIALAAALGARVTACHVYGCTIHRHRFVEMEPGLPSKYQDGETLNGLRMAHAKLIDEGFRALSAGYVEDFVASSRTAGIDTESVAMEGRSYVGILHLARARDVDLIVLGFDGLGAVGNGMLGGTTTRVLGASRCDVLVVREAFEGGSVLVGIDPCTSSRLTIPSFTLKYSTLWRGHFRLSAKARSDWPARRNCTMRSSMTGWASCTNSSSRRRNTTSAITTLI